MYVSNVTKKIYMLHFAVFNNKIKLLSRLIEKKHILMCVKQ